MSETAARMAKEPERIADTPSGETLNDLAPELIAKYRRNHGDLATLEARLRSILPIVGHILASEFGEEHFDFYERERATRPAPRQGLPSRTTIMRETQVIRSMLRLRRDRREAPRGGRTIGGVEDSTGVSYPQLHEWERAGFLPRDVEPAPGYATDNTALYSATSVLAIEKVKHLTALGASLQSVKRAVARLREIHGYASNAEALVRSQIIVEAGNLLEETSQGIRVSLLHRPRHTPARNEHTIAGFGEKIFIPAERKRLRNGATFKVYLSQLREHIFPFFGDYSFGEVQQHVREFARLESNEDNEPETIEDWLGRLSGLLELARQEGLYDGPPLDKSVPGLRKRRNERPVLAPEVIRRFVAALWAKGETLWALWVLLRVVLGLRTREACAVQWRDVGEQDILIRRSCYAGRVRPASDREMRDVPLPKLLRRLLREQRKKAEFKGEKDFVFASSTREKPTNPTNIYARHLRPVADKLEIARNSLFKLENAARILTAKAGLHPAQQESVLRLPWKVVEPPHEHIEATRVALERAIQLVFPPELLNPSDPDSTPEEIERKRLADDRKDRLQAFEDEMECTHVAVADSAKIDISDLYKWRRGEIKDSSKKARAIESVLSGETRLTKTLKRKKIKN